MRADPATLLILTAAACSLAACQVRSDNDEPAPPEEDAATPPSAAMASAEPEDSETPVASIIRDEEGTQPLDPPVQALVVSVPFGEGGNDLTERAERVLAGVLRSRALDEGWPVILRGHTDSEGDDRANLRASRARAEAVAAWLVERGVDDERIRVIAIGEQNPIAPNALPDGEPNEAGRAKNRRVDIEIAPETPRPSPTPSQVARDAGGSR